MSLTKLNFFSSTHRHVMDVGVSYVTHLFKTVYFFLCFFLFSSLEFYVKTTKLITLDFCTGISKKIMSFFFQFRDLLALIQGSTLMPNLRSGKTPPFPNFLTINSLFFQLIVLCVLCTSFIIRKFIWRALSSEIY